MGLPVISTSSPCCRGCGEDAAKPMLQEVEIRTAPTQFKRSIRIRRPCIQFNSIVAAAEKHWLCRGIQEIHLQAPKRERTSTNRRPSRYSVVNLQADYPNSVEARPIPIPGTTAQILPRHTVVREVPLALARCRRCEEGGAFAGCENPTPQILDWRVHICES